MMASNSVQNFVQKESGQTYEQTAGSCNHKAEPLPREAEQQREEATQHNQAPAADTEAAENEGNKSKRRSIFNALHLPHLHKDGKNSKSRSISDSGPLEVVQDPQAGRFIARPNPHGPEEDSWKREDVRSGKGDSDVVAPGGVGGVSYY